MSFTRFSSALIVAALGLNGCMTSPKDHGMPQRSSMSQQAQSAAGACVARDTLYRRNQFKAKLADLNSRYSGVDHALVFDGKDWGNPTAIRATRERIRTLRSLIDERDELLSRYFDGLNADVKSCDADVQTVASAKNEIDTERQHDQPCYTALSAAQRESVAVVATLMDFVEAHPDVSIDPSGQPHFADAAESRQLAELEAHLQQAADKEIQADKALAGT
jgi:hypothetical protein